jgi:Major Facilitator Superfamily
VHLILIVTNLTWNSYFDFCPQVPFRICGLAGIFSACIIYVILSTAGSRKEPETVGNENRTVCELNGDSRSHGNRQTSSHSQVIDGLSLSTSNGRRMVKRNGEGKTASEEPSRQQDEILVCPVNIKGPQSSTESADNVDNVKSRSEILIRCLFSVNLWLVMIVGGLTTFVLKSMSDWTGLFLVEHFSLTIAQSTELMLWNEMGGMLGTLLCGVLSDYLGGRRFLTLLIFTVICISGAVYFPTVFPISLQVADGQSDLSLAFSSPFVFNKFAPEMFVKSLQSYILALFRFVHTTFSGHIGAARICLFLMGFGINGPKTLLGVIVRDLVPREVSGTVGGIFGLISQVGASASGAG